MKENNESNRNVSLEGNESSSSYRGINNILNAVNNGKESDDKDVFIKENNSCINSPSSMTKNNNQKDKTISKNPQNNKSNETFDIDLTTALSNLKNGMDKGFGEVRNDIKEIGNNIKEMGNNIIEMKTELKKGLQNISDNISNLSKSIYGLIIIIFAFIIYNAMFLQNKK